MEEALAVADRIGYPIVVRPSYVLGGRAMAIGRRSRPLRVACLYVAALVREFRGALLVTGALVAVELDIAVGSCGKRRQETHQSPRQAAVDAGRAMQRMGSDPNRRRTDLLDLLDPH